MCWEPAGPPEPVRSGRQARPEVSEAVSAASRKRRGEAPKGAPARVMGRRSRKGPARPQGGPKVRRSAPAPLGASPPPAFAGGTDCGAGAPLKIPRAMTHAHMTTERTMSTTREAHALHPPLEGEGRLPKRSGGSRGGVSLAMWASPHPVSHLAALDASVAARARAVIVRRLSSFETRPSAASQDEDLVLRRPRSGRLEGPL